MAKPKPTNETQASEDNTVALDPAAGELSRQEAHEIYLKKVESLRPIANRMQREEEVINRWAVTLERGVERQMLLEPRFWAHLGMNLRPYDEITVRCDDGTLYARYLVLACDRLWARVEELEWRTLSSRDISMTQAAQMARAGYRIEHRGPHLLWCVMRKTDNSQISTGHQTDRMAEDWLQNYIRTIGAGL